MFILGNPLSVWGWGAIGGAGDGCPDYAGHSGGGVSYGSNHLPLDSGGYHSLLHRGWPPRPLPQEVQEVIELSRCLNMLSVSCFTCFLSFCA